MMDSSVFFLIASTAIALMSMHLNFRFTKTKVRADQAFWLAWIFLIWSAETVTSFSYFEFYNKYSIDSETRTLTIMTFLASAVGFLLGSVLYRQAPGAQKKLSWDTRIATFAKRWQGWAAIAIFTVGLIEFATNQGKFSNLLELRIAAVAGELQTGIFYTQFFLFSQAFLMLIGFSDGLNAKVSRGVVVLIIVGLVLHNLAVGGRINIIVAPAIYLILFILMANQRDDWNRNVKPRVWKVTSILAALVITLFGAVKLYRSYGIEMANIISIDGLLINFLFAIPMYISETFISIAVHVDHARVSEMPFGYFTFDAFYRLFGFILSLHFQDPNTVFGHAYYRDTPDPWAWTQTNLIPRLISDFGSLFWLALVPISALVQWLSLYRMRLSFVGVVIRGLMVFSSAYTILAALWFSSMNVYILFYAFLLYFLAKRSPLNGDPKIFERRDRRRLRG